MAKKRRVSARELERRLVRKLESSASYQDVNSVVNRLRRYAIAREFRAYTAFDRLAETSAGLAMSKGQIECAIRDRLRTGDR